MTWVDGGAGTGRVTYATWEAAVAVAIAATLAEGGGSLAFYADEGEDLVGDVELVGEARLREN